MNREEFLHKMEEHPHLNDEEYNSIINLSIECTDPKIKMVVIMEEMAELIQQVSKQLRGDGDRVALLEEMADVTMCMDFLQRLVGFTDEDLINAVEVKAIREKERRLNQLREEAKKIILS